MAEKILRLHPSRGFFLEAGLHLVNPEKPVVILPEAYEAPNKIKTAIKHGVLIDVNQNILAEVQEQEQEILPPAPTEVDKSLTDEGQVEAKEEVKEEQKEEKPKAKSKSKAKAKDKE